MKLGNFLVLILNGLVSVFLAAAQLESLCVDSKLAKLLSTLDLPSEQISPAIATLQAGICKGNVSFSPVQQAASACSIVRYVFGAGNGSTFIPTYLEPSSPVYVSRIDINWYASLESQILLIIGANKGRSDNCWLDAKCIVSPLSTEDVSRIMSVIAFTGTKFAIRSGGHNPNVGYSSIDGSGLLIDMVNLNQTQLSFDKKTISIGPGQRFGLAYEQLDKLGYFFNAARNPDVGVGGLFLGGGMIFFTSNYGLAVNGIQNIELVLSNSTVVQANAKSNPDLFWAQKGGGPNFGIITRYDVDAIPSTPVWFETRLYNPSQLSELLEAVVEYEAAAEFDDDANLVFQSFPTTTLVGFIYRRPIERPPIFNMFYNIPFNSSVTNSTLGSVYQLTESYASAQSETQSRYAGVSVVHKPNINTYKETYATYLDIANQVTQNFSGLLTYGIQPFTSNAARRSHRNGDIPLNLTAVSQDWFISTIQWSDSKDDESAFKALQIIGDSVRSSAERYDGKLQFINMNDANNMQDVLKSYGDASLARLRAVSQMYDPQQVFQRLQNNGFLLSKASRT